MPSLSDLMLAGGNAVLIESVHGEPFFILSGADAGKTFVAVQEHEQDIILDTDIGEDKRTKRIARFRIPNVPNLTSQDKLQDSSGKTWCAVRRPGASFLTVDFELSEVFVKPVTPPIQPVAQANPIQPPGVIGPGGDAITGPGGDPIIGVGE
jgi:hypothetical protein